MREAGGVRGDTGHDESTSKHLSAATDGLARPTGQNVPYSALNEDGRGVDIPLSFLTIMFVVYTLTEHSLPRQLSHPSPK